MDIFYDSCLYLDMYASICIDLDMYFPFLVTTVWVYIGVRDRPYGICCPWVRGGWDLDALGKFFRRRRRRRRRRRLGVPT